jgi:hypothetical protein
MIHLRIVAPADVAHQALELLLGAPSVLNVAICTLRPRSPTATDPL